MSDYIPAVEPLHQPSPLTPDVAGPSRSSAAVRIGEWVKTSGRLHLAVIAVVTLGAIVLAVWLAVTVRRASSSLESQRASLVKSGADAMSRQSAALLKLSALPLAWAMRAALLKDDFQTVDVYLQNMIREPHVTGAVLIGPDGRVRLAGNRKLEKVSVADAFPGISITAERPAVIATGADARVVVPVMGLDRRLGTLILSYEVLLPSGWDPPAP